MLLAYDFRSNPIQEASMKRFLKRPMLATTVAVITVAMAWASQTTLAQGGQPGNPADLQAVSACTTTSYADIAAKALGITAAELRKDIVSGQTLQDIARSKNVNIQTVTTALQSASTADIEQAVKDGVLTQDQAKALESGVSGAPGSPPAAPPGGAPGGAPGNPPDGAPGQLPDISTFRSLLQLSAPASGQSGQAGQGPNDTEMFNVVKPYTVVAQALNLKCTDPVKTVTADSGKSIAAVALAQKVDAKTVTDALTKAYKAALAQDVANGIIAQAQSDQAVSNLDKAVTSFINNTSRMGPGSMPTTGQSGAVATTAPGAAGGTANNTSGGTTAAYTLNGGSATKTNQTIPATKTDESAVYVSNGGTLILTNSTITTSGDTSSNDNSSFYGLNAAVLAGAGSKITLSGSSVTTSGSGANGVFATGTGASVTLSNVKIRATGDGGHGVMATLGGRLTLTNVDMDTPNYEEYPHWSPDGRYILFMAIAANSRTTNEPNHIDMMNADGSNPVTLADGYGPARVIESFVF
jgi:hypothetical protein